MQKKKKDWYNVSLKGVQGFKGMSHEHKSLNTTILKKGLKLKCMKKNYDVNLYYFGKAHFFENILLRRFEKNIFLKTLIKRNSNMVKETFFFEFFFYLDTVFGFFFKKKKKKVFETFSL